MKKGLECQQIHFFYPINDPHHQGVLVNLNYHFQMARLTLVTGPTGSGKSTLLYLLAGLSRPSQGQILANGQPVSRWISRHLDLWRRNVGLVLQEPYLIEDLTVMENVAAPLIPLNLSRTAVTQRIISLLERLDLRKLTTKPAGLLSGGERQRVTLARALIGRPDFLLADEPTAFQDNLHTAVIMDLLTSARDHGSCVVVCSHDERLLSSQRFDATLRLRHGRLEVHP